MEADVNPALAVLCSVLSLNVPPHLGWLTLELQPVLLNRTKARELMKRDRRWQKYLRQMRAFLWRSFTDVYASWPGSSNSTLSSSDLFLKAQDRPDSYLFPREKSLPSDGVEIPVHLISDASLPLKPWLMMEDAFLPEQCVDMAPHRMHLIQPAAEPFKGDSYNMAEVIRDTISYNLLTLLPN